MALHFTVLYSTSSKSCIQLNSFDGCSTSFILDWQVLKIQFENKEITTRQELIDLSLPEWYPYQANNEYHAAKHHFLRMWSAKNE